MNAIDEMPRSALLLGYGGVLPFAGLALSTAFNLPVPVSEPDAMLVGYGAIILSFMGGVHWGLAMQSNARKRHFGTAWHYALSVIPALVGWMALMLATPHALISLAGAFLILLIVDVTWTSGRRAPRWYGKLRLQLTSAVLLCLGLAWAST